jgi:hypothetical protein
LLSTFQKRRIEGSGVGFARLEKVEELTLYILQQQQQIDELKRILAEQQ